MFYYALRNLRTNKIRSLFTVVSIALAIMIPIVILLSYASILYQNKVQNLYLDGKSNLDVYSISSFSSKEISDINNLSPVKKTEFLQTKEIFIRTQLNQGVPTLIPLVNEQNHMVALREIHLSNGNFPGNNKEIIISNGLAEQLSISLHQTVYLSTFYGNLPFKVAGILNVSKGSSSFINYGIAIPQKEYNTYFYKGSSISLIAIETNNVNKTISQIKNLKIAFSNITINNKYNSVLGSIIPLLFVVLIIDIFVGNLIVNRVLYLEILRRRKNIGLMAAIGISRGKIVRLFLYEGFMLCFLGLLLGISGGIFFGFLLAHVFYSQNLPFGIYHFADSYYYMGIAGEIGILFLSTFLAALKTGKYQNLKSMQEYASFYDAHKNTSVILGMLFLVSGIIFFFIYMASFSFLNALLSFISVLMAFYFLGAKIIKYVFSYLSRVTHSIVFPEIKSHSEYYGNIFGLIVLSSTSFIIAASLIFEIFYSDTFWLHQIYPGKAIITSPIRQTASLVKVFGNNTLFPYTTVAFAEVKVNGGYLPVDVVNAKYYQNEHSLVFLNGAAKKSYQELLNGNGILVPASLFGTNSIGRTITIGYTNKMENFTVVGVVQHTFPDNTGKEGILMNVAQAQNIGITGFNEIIVNDTKFTDWQSLASTYGMSYEKVSDLTANTERQIWESIGIIFIAIFLMLMLILFNMILFLGFVIADNNQHRNLLLSVGINSSQLWQLSIKEIGSIFLFGFIISGFIARIGLGFIHW